MELSVLRSIGCASKVGAAAPKTPNDSEVRNLGKKKSQAKWEIKERSIYAILFEEQKTFYIGKTVISNLWKAYDFHYRGKNAITDQLFEQYKGTGQLPKMFLLDKVLGTDHEAFQHCIVWSKYFSENGFTCLCGDKMKSFIADLDAETETLYFSIRDIPLSQICSEDKNLFPEFRNSSKRKRSDSTRIDPDKVRFELIMSREEYDFYKKSADKYGVSMTQLFLDCIRHGDVFQLDTSVLEEYIRISKGYSNMLSGIISTILTSMQYVPSDIDRLCEVSKEVIETNKLTKRELERLCRTMLRMKTTITNKDI